MADIDGYVQKKKTDKLQYSFVSVDDIIAAIRPALVAHGVAIYPCGVRDLLCTSEKNDKGTTMTTVSGLFAFTFAHGDSGTTAVAEVASEGKDSGDKAHNKAMTAAYKYVLKQTFMIETGDNAKQQRKSDSGRSEPSQPLSAQSFKAKYLITIGETDDGMPASTEQARYLASVMGEAYKSIPDSTDKTRVAVLSWLLDRPVQSSANLTKTEVSTLINRVTTKDGKLSELGKSELIELYMAANAAPKAESGDSEPEEEEIVPDWTDISRSQYWKDAKAKGASAPDVFRAANVKNAGEFFMQFNPNAAYDILTMLAEEKSLV